MATSFLAEMALELGQYLWTADRKQREKFFREMFEPQIHKQVLKFQKEHEATFKEVLGVLRDAKRPIKDAVQIVNDRERIERQSWMRFGNFSAIPSKEREDSPYWEYLRSVRSCVYKVRGQPDSIVFYRGLRQELTEVVSEASGASPQNEEAIRAEALQRVDELLVAFQEHCQRVERSYLLFRNECLA